jgi:hypothetical protein
MPKTFSWSWSRLKNFRNCPKRHWEIDLQKNFKEPEGDALKWGHDVHAALAAYIYNGKPLPKTMERYTDVASGWVALKKAGVPVLVEQKLAMDADFKPCGFFDHQAWYRGVVDVMAIGNGVAHAGDWKTGKMPDDGDAEYEQLGLTAQLIFAHYPDIKEVSTTFVWLGFDDTTERTYTNDGMVPLWNKLWPQINVMKDAFRTTTYPAKPSGLCVRHCPVNNCPYHGKGTR